MLSLKRPDKWLMQVIDSKKAQIETDDVAILTCHVLPNAAIVIPRNQLGRVRDIEGEAGFQQIVPLVVSSPLVD